VDSILPEGFVPETTGTKSGKASRRRLAVVAGARRYEISDFWGDGFSLPPGAPEPNRGFVDVFDGSRHVLHCLAYKIGESGDGSVYAFKIGQDPERGQPHDYAGDPDRPIALIGKS